jgi:hypothetical protein
MRGTHSNSLILFVLHFSIDAMCICILEFTVIEIVWESFCATKSFIKTRAVSVRTGEKIVRAREIVPLLRNLPHQFPHEPAYPSSCFFCQLICSLAQKTHCSARVTVIQIPTSSHWLLFISY